MEERYKALSNVVQSHSLLSLGLSLFIPNDDDQEEVQQFQVHNFHFLLLSNQSFLMSPTSCAFLGENGFDFNGLIRDAIPFPPGMRLEEVSEPPQNGGSGSGGRMTTGVTGKGLPRNSPGYALRSLFQELLKAKVPLVVHNGLLDLMFLYHSLYCHLPQDLGTFLADLSDLTEGGGLYDTKFVAEFLSREKASFLSYLFRKW